MKPQKLILGVMVVALLASGLGTTMGTAGNFEGFGTGARDTVILIHNVYELQNMSKNLSAHYALANDINASATRSWNNGSGFIPVGGPGKEFSGEFDGNGYNITGLFINSSSSYVGLFGITSKDAIIKDVNLVNANVHGESFVGALIGDNEGAGVSYITVSGNVSGTKEDIGGMIGYNTGSVLHCYASEINVSGPGNSEYSGAIGGLIGLSNGVVEYASAMGTVRGSYDVGLLIGLIPTHSSAAVVYGHASGTVRGIMRVGGLIGYIADYGTSTVTDSSASAQVNGTKRAGGLIGEADGGTTVSYCHSAGAVNGTYYAGGLVGYNKGSISNSYSEANISGQSHLGGLVGYSDGTLSNSFYNIDAVTIRGGHYISIGGMFGAQYRNWSKNGMKLSISNYSSTLLPDGNYYDIKSVQGIIDMLGFSESNLNFRLAANLNLSGHANLFIPYFHGTFDGQNHTIYNFSYNTTFIDYAGMFGYTRGTIENLHMVNGSIAGGTYTGLIAGKLRGTVKYCQAEGTVRGSGYNGVLIGDSSGTVEYSNSSGSVSGSNNVGGLVGNNGGTIRNCSSSANAKSSDDVGGLAGSNGGLIVNSHASGTVRGSNLGAGGLVGTNNRNIVNCYATGYVSSSGNFVGGLVGSNYAGGSITRSYATGTVSGYNTVGGLVGYSYGWTDFWGTYDSDVSITKSYATGSVYGNYGVGGLVGEDDGLIANCYATGHVSGSGDVGGLVGSLTRADSGGSYAGFVNDSYSTGKVWGSSHVGGLIGSSAGTVKNSFWDKESSGKDSSYGGTGATTNEMMSKATFLAAGWDFTNIWKIWDGRTYPFFSWQNITSVPAAPLNFRVRVENGHVNLTWMAPADDGGHSIYEYRIYRGNASGNESLIATVNSTVHQYLDTNVSYNHTYYYYVTAVNSLGEGLHSMEENVSLQAGVSYPSPPRELAVSVGIEYVVLSWHAPTSNGGENITEYKIYRGTEPGKEVLIAVVNATTFTYNDTHVLGGETYYYYITAVNSAGESNNSAEISATPESVPELSPLSLIIILPLLALWLRRKK